MPSRSTQLDEAYESYRRHAARWTNLIEQHFPIEASGTIWRSSQARSDKLPSQGWKLHVSASLLNAADILEAVVHALREMPVVSKAACSLVEVKRINCGLFYGFCQIGKVITLYPETIERAVLLAQKLASATAGYDAPAVPYELRVSPTSTVYARYGTFKNSPNPLEPSKLVSPDGSFQSDLRHRNPSWAVPPHGLASNGQTVEKRGLLATNFRAFSALSQRGKGGVYKALDLTVAPARLCIIKEGRRHGEVDVNGEDGARWVQREAIVLRELAAANVPVPRLYANFEENQNQYLALEYIDGVSLAEHILNGISIQNAVRYSLLTCEILAQIHACGWVWRDLKPANLVLSSDGSLVAVDFEGAARISTTISPWGTPSYLPPEWATTNRASFPQDLYALGAAIWQLFSGELVTPEADVAAHSSTKILPSSVVSLVLALLSATPDQRPSAVEVAHSLRQLELVSDVSTFGEVVA